jgi:hypothetical protein
MSTAQVHDGHAIVAYIGGKAVDSDGKEIEGAPKQPKDTDPSKQPHALAQLNPEERSAAVLATAFATAMGKTPPKAATATADEDEDEDVDVELPRLDDLEKHLAKFKTADQVRALQARDERVGATRMYEARIAELGG